MENSKGKTSSMHTLLNSLKAYKKADELRMSCLNDDGGLFVKFGAKSQRDDMR